MSGLDYRYYEGNWSALPDFTPLTAVKSGTSSGPVLSVRNQEYNYGLRFTGYISVPTDGIYTFYTTSDDGSKLLIGTTEVVNNDGQHGDMEKSGTIGLKAGVHAVSIVYFQSGGGQTLLVSYSGPGIGKQTIPDAAFFRISTSSTGTGSGSGSGTGLLAAYFNNKDLVAPVVLNRIDATIDFDWGNNSPAAGTVSVDNFSVKWTGQVEAPVTGNYTFSTVSDDGVRLWVNGTMLINNWAVHAPTTDNGPVIALTAGQKYDIRMEYFEGSGGATAKLLWSYPGQNQQVIPQTRLYPAAGGGLRVAAVTDNEPDSDVAVQVYPIPAREEVRVRYYAVVAGEVLLQLTTIAAQPVIREIHPVGQGENLIRIPVRDLNRGIYLMTLIQGHQRITRKVLLTE